MFSDRAMRDFGPTFWNLLDKNIQHSETMKHFRIQNSFYISIQMISFRGMYCMLLFICSVHYVIDSCFGNWTWPWPGHVRFRFFSLLIVSSISCSVFMNVCCLMFHDIRIKFNVIWCNSFTLIKKQHKTKQNKQKTKQKQNKKQNKTTNKKQNKNKTKKTKQKQKNNIQTNKTKQSQKKKQYKKQNKNKNNNNNSKRCFLLPPPEGKRLRVAIAEYRLLK